MARPVAFNAVSRVQQFRETGTLWGSTDESEAITIREWVELLADVPMGYGRVGRAPTVLDYDELDVSPFYTK